MRTLISHNLALQVALYAAPTDAGGAASPPVRPAPTDTLNAGAPEGGAKEDADLLGAAVPRSGDTPAATQVAAPMPSPEIGNPKRPSRVKTAPASQPEPGAEITVRLLVDGPDGKANQLVRVPVTRADELVAAYLGRRATLHDFAFAQR